MDSKVVSREIKRLVWPELRAEGFDTFTSRVAWRHWHDRIDVLEFRSFNAYNADLLGVTTFSFSVSLGCLPLYIPPEYPLRTKDGLQLPSEPECFFRGRLQCSLASKLSDKSVWPVDPDGRNLGWCMQDVVKQIPAALAWFERLSRKEHVLRVLQGEDEQMWKLWGYGRNPSPFRSYLTGYAALALGDQELARQKLQEAVASRCYTHLFTGVEGALHRAS